MCNWGKLKLRTSQATQKVRDLTNRSLPKLYFNESIDRPNAAQVHQ